MKTNNKKHKIRLNRLEKELFTEIEKYCRKYGACWAAGLAHKYNITVSDVVNALKTLQDVLPETIKVTEGSKKIYKITIDEKERQKQNS